MHRLLSVPRPAGPILDAGTGVGELVPTVSALSDRVLALDLEARFLRGVDPQVRGDPRVHLLAGSVYRLPLSDGSLSAVVCVRVLHRLADPGRALRELRRALALGGVLVASFQPPRSWKRWSYRFWRSLAGDRHATAAPDTSVDLLGAAHASGFRLEQLCGSGLEELPLGTRLSVEQIARLSAFGHRNPLFPTWFG
ncbi:MAG TPA: class I SAM-dependent methyltransferase [Thermoplasmata archaeon]|nr:class I SAM-dependent methyltransferase [Thermoplasmata archaeon]